MPTPTQYTYTISADFPNGSVATDRLDKEIRESTIVTALDRIDTAGDSCEVWFKDAISSEDKTTLDGLVTAHNGVALPSGPNLDNTGNTIVALYPDTSFGITAVSVLNTPDAAVGLVKSWQMTVAPETTDIQDIFIGDDLVGPTGKCFLVGGEYRCRTSAVEGSALAFAIVDRDDLLGIFQYYGLSRTKLTGLTNISGTISPGDYAYGDTSQKSARVISVGSDFCEVTFHEGVFVDGETLTFKAANGTPTGATATLGSWDEGDVVELQRSVKDEWVEGFDQRTVQPGGSKQLPAGLYFRVIIHNASTTDNLRVKVSLVMATL